MRDPLRHLHHLDKPNLYGDSFAERTAEKVANGMGTVGFILISTALIFGWTMINHLPGFLSASYTGLLHGKGFDPAPFILLNLIFSAVAFYTGALVVIAQKSQSKKDRANEEAAAKHREELHAEIVTLIEQNTALTKTINDHIAAG